MLQVKIITKVSTYKDKEVKYDNDDNYRNNKIKRYPTSKGEGMMEYYDKYNNNNNYNKYDEYNNELQNSRAQRKMNEQYNNNNYRENSKNNRGYNENSNILNCVLMLLKELNKNELNILKNEIEKEKNY